MKKTGRNKKIVVWGLLIAASLVIAFSIKGTACSMDKGERGRRAMEEYCRSVEKEYVVNVKKILKDNGYTNAGVMLTKVFNNDGTRRYTLSINHRRFAGAEEKAENIKEKIMSQLEKMITRLKSRPRDYTFIEAKTLLLALNYSIDNKGRTSGSRVAFWQADKSDILLHKPHHGNNFKSYQIKDLLEVLEKDGMI